MVTIKRKAPTPAGDEVSAPRSHRPSPLFECGAWHHVAARAKSTAFGSVSLRLRVAGRLALAAEDTAPDRLADPGAVGVRGDSTELFFRTLIVR